MDFINKLQDSRVTTDFFFLGGKLKRKSNHPCLLSEKIEASILQGSVRSPNDSAECLFKRDPFVCTLNTNLKIYADEMCIVGL
jgi:hypothetical protein